MNKIIKISFEEAKKRFINQGRIDIELCKNGYVSWTQKARFYDLIEKDFFWAQPKSVYSQKSGHPNRTNLKRKQTNLKKYGFENPTKSLKIKEKISNSYNKKTKLEKQTIKQKRKETNVKKHGVEHPLQSEVKKEKYKATCLKKYGVDNISKLNNIKNKKKKTLIKNYGVESPIHSAKIKQKTKQTNIKKYGKENIFTKYVIKETGQLMKNWLKEQPSPKPAYSTIQSWLAKSKNLPENLSLSLIEDFCEKHKTNKTTLEIKTEELFAIKHFNKKVNHSIKHRPDFKITETVYINVDGLYWHSEKQKNKYYHWNLRKDFEKNNCKIFQFYENEIVYKSSIVKSIVNHALKRSKQCINVDSCEVKFVEQKQGNVFLNQNHLLGSIKSKHIGLFFENRPVALLSYTMKKNNMCEIKRFCYANNTHVEHGFLELLKHLQKIKTFKTKICMWIDLRFEDDLFLKENNFVFCKEKLNWVWTNGKETFKKDTKSHKQAKELGWYKIYNAGQKLFILKQ